MEPRDENGLTEAEFLAQYKQKDYPKPSLTADIAIFKETAGGLQVLLIKRGGHPYLGCWATPGGFVNKGETADAAAARELAEETGVEGLALEQLGLYSGPDRDPRGWTVSQAYLSVCEEGRLAHAGDDAQDAKWFTISEKRGADGTVTLTASCGDIELTSRFRPVEQRFSAPKADVVEGSGFAFDHANIVADAYLRYRYGNGTGAKDDA
jgi:8-oxo-dGTP diphosphatase